MVDGVLRKNNTAIIIFVLLSIAISIYILATDDHIYEHALSHAYVLMVFAGVYATLLGLLRLHSTKVRMGICVVASIQLVAMNLDILTAGNIPIFQVHGLEFEELFEHIFGSWYFDVLFGAQAVLVGLCIRSRMYEAKIARSMKS